MQYSLSPGCSLLDVVDRLALDYYNARKSLSPYEMSMQPGLVHALNVECTSRFATVVGNLQNPTGYQVMRLQTVAGAVIIVARPNLELPIFIGSEEELKDNSFNTSMEEILCE